jgi:hypothetical protein
MKGVADPQNILLALGFLFITFMIILPNFGVKLPLIGEAREVEANVTLETYTMENALTAARLFGQSGFRYSIYQGCHNTFKGLRGSSLPDGTEFLSSLGKSIEDTLSEYTSSNYTFLGEYSVSMPSFAVSVDEKGNVTASGSTTYFILKQTETHAVLLERSSNMTEDAQCVGQYHNGLDARRKIDAALKAAVGDPVKEWHFKGTGEPGIVKGEYITVPADKNTPEQLPGYLCGQAFLQTHGRTMESVGGEIRDSILGDSSIRVSSESGGFRVESGDADVLVSLEPEIVGDVQNNPGSVNVTCRITYAARASVPVSVTGGKAVPVSEGNDIRFIAPALDFSVEETYSSEGIKVFPPGSYTLEMEIYGPHEIAGHYERMLDLSQSGASLSGKLYEKSKPAEKVSVSGSFDDSSFFMPSIPLTLSVMGIQRAANVVLVAEIDDLDIFSGEIFGTYKSELPFPLGGERDITGRFEARKV